MTQNIFADDNDPRESIMIHEKYQSNASLLAEALCETGEAGDEAKRDFKLLSHAKDCLSDWLPRNTWRTARLVSVVLEPGYDYLHQLDTTIEWLVSETFGANVASELAATKHKELAPSNDQQGTNAFLLPAQPNRSNHCRHWEAAAWHVI